jgi:hypothetical protein
MSEKVIKVHKFVPATQDEGNKVIDSLIGGGHIEIRCPGCGMRGAVNPKQAHLQLPGCPECGQAWDAETWIQQGGN